MSNKMTFRELSKKHNLSYNYFHMMRCTSNEKFKRIFDNDFSIDVAFTNYTKEIGKKIKFIEDAYYDKSKKKIVYKALKEINYVPNTKNKSLLCTTFYNSIFQYREEIVKIRYPFIKKIELVYGALTNEK